MMVCGLWRSLVARRTGGAKVAGSNPVSPILIMRIGSVSKLTTVLLAFS